MKILIIRPDAIGDCVLITPAITALKKDFPKANITLLVQELTKDLFTTNPDVAEVMIDKIVSRQVKNPLDFLKYAAEIRSKNFDLAIHYFNEPAYALLTRLAGIKKRLGDPSKPLISWLYNIKVYQNWRDIIKHDVEQNLLLLKPLGIKPPYPKLSLYAEPEALKKVEQLLQDHGVNENHKIAGLHLSTGKGNKAWSPENFGRLADYLSKQGFKVVATGQANDKKLIQKAQAAASNKIIDLSLKTDLKELIALTSKYSLFVSVDTGPYHIAAALGIPMVAISTSKFSLPLRWGPWQNRHVLVRKKSNCALFCHPANCKVNTCAEEITFAEVKAAVETLLAGGGNKTQAEALADWCRKSFSIMIAYKPRNQKRAEQIYDQLTQHGFYAVMVNIKQKHDYQKLFKENNTNILHAVDPSFKVRFQALVSGKSLIVPVLYVKDKKEQQTFAQFFDYYKTAFAASKI